MSREALRVNVQIATRTANVPSPARIRRWVAAANSGAAEITVRIVGEREGRTLNERFRRRAEPTNVLAFAYGRDAGPLRGDVVLCAPVVAREAREQKKPLAAHYAHLTVHGVLHLRGYTHDADGDAARMERAERTILKRLGYPDPYA
jgi:probable rRNA maturation factor